jgi:hypothetical protein
MNSINAAFTHLFKDAAGPVAILQVINQGRFHTCHKNVQLAFCPVYLRQFVSLNCRHPV